MAGILKKIAVTIRNTKTYQVGLLQAKAYRILKQHTGDALEHLNITTTEWAFLGLLYEKKVGIRAMDAAQELGVEAPFVTTLLKKLQKIQYVEVREDPSDSRAKLLCITDTGRTFVEETENYLRSKMRTLVKGASISDLTSYITILELIIQNAPKKN